jgi:hypothetical protein
MKNVAFTMQFFGQGWKEKLSNVNEQHSSPPDMSIVTRVRGPG